MEPVTNYWLLWAVYLSASAVFFGVFWPMTRFRRHQWLSLFLRGTVIAFAFTPWYANPEGTVLAPALMVVMLDAITIGGAAAVRALVPLFLAVILTWILVFAWYLFTRKFRQKKHNKQKVMPAK